jgi:hypothetical protein
MRFSSKFIILLFGLSLFACAGSLSPSTPIGTLKAYTTAIKKKDTTTMKLLLSDASIKMAEQEAKAQNVTLDDIVKRETLFSESQSSLKYRNEKIEGDKATIEVANSFGSFDTVPFVKEEGSWKIDKQGFANQLLQQMDEQNKKFDDIINQGRQP